jgi:hypothetical protein
MAAITTHVIKEMAPTLGAKQVKVTLPATADSGDTVAITLANYGMVKFEGILGMVHSTEDSIIIGEAPTTAVVGGVLTVTVGGSGANNLKRCYVIWGE